MYAEWACLNIPDSWFIDEVSYFIFATIHPKTAALLYSRLYKPKCDKLVKLNKATPTCAIKCTLSIPPFVRPFIECHERWRETGRRAGCLHWDSLSCDPIRDRFCSLGLVRVTFLCSCGDVYWSSFVTPISKQRRYLRRFVIIKRSKGNRQNESC